MPAVSHVGETQVVWDLSRVLGLRAFSRKKGIIEYAWELEMSRYLDWLLLATIVIISLASPLVVLEFVSGKY